MRNIWEDSLKTRLIDRLQLLRAVETMLARGVPEELIPVHLTRAFYVDMDELNAVLQYVRQVRGETPADGEEAVDHPDAAIRAVA